MKNVGMALLIAFVVNIVMFWPLADVLTDGYRLVAFAMSFGLGTLVAWFICSGIDKWAKKSHRFNKA